MVLILSDLSEKLLLILTFFSKNKNLHQYPIFWKKKFPRFGKKIVFLQKKAIINCSQDFKLNKGI
jgi:hypothetical protein